MFFSAIIELVQDLVTSNMHNKLEKDTYISEGYELFCPQGNVNADALTTIATAQLF